MWKKGNFLENVVARFSCCKIFIFFNFLFLFDVLADDQHLFSFVQVEWSEPSCEGEPNSHREITNMRDFFNGECHWGGLGDNTYVKRECTGQGESSLWSTTFWNDNTCQTPHAVRETKLQKSGECIDSMKRYFDCSSSSLPNSFERSPSLISFEETEYQNLECTGENPTVFKTVSPTNTCTSYTDLEGLKYYIKWICDPTTNELRNEWHETSSCNDTNISTSDGEIEKYQNEACAEDYAAQHYWWNSCGDSTGPCTSTSRVVTGCGEGLDNYGCVEGSSGCGEYVPPSSAAHSISAFMIITFQLILIQ